MGLHPQSSPRGLWARSAIQVDDVYFNDYSVNTSLLSDDSTGLVLAGGVKVSDARYITANSTAYTLTAESSLPGNVDGGAAFTLISNSTGVALAVNSTGTDWKYLNVTSAQPT